MGTGKYRNNVSISLERGERNGMDSSQRFWKDDLCKILAGYEKPDHGTVGVRREKYFFLCWLQSVQMIWQHPELSVNSPP